jgi:hypothetical protein
MLHLAVVSTMYSTAGRHTLGAAQIAPQDSRAIQPAHGLLSSHVDSTDVAHALFACATGTINPTE